jgi:hypothetical protein
MLIGLLLSKDCCTPKGNEQVCTLAERVRSNATRDEIYGADFLIFLGLLVTQTQARIELPATGQRLMSLLKCIIINQFIFPLFSLFCNGDDDIVVSGKKTGDATGDPLHGAHFFAIFGCILANRIWIALAAIDLLRPASVEHSSSTTFPLYYYVLGWAVPLAICFVLAAVADEVAGCW